MRCEVLQNIFVNFSKSELHKRHFCILILCGRCQMSASTMSNTCFFFCTDFGWKYLTINMKHRRKTSESQTCYFWVLLSKKQISVTVGMINLKIKLFCKNYGLLTPPLFQKWLLHKRKIKVYLKSSTHFVKSGNLPNFTG